MAASTYVVVVERGKCSTTVGPYRSRKAADKDQAKWGDEGRTAWVEPVVAPADFAKVKPGEEPDTFIHR